MTEFVIRPDANDIRINTQSGVVVSDNTASVVVNCPGEEVTIRPGQSATVVIKGGIVASNSDFQNLFIGYPLEFPAVTHESLLLRTGQFADPDILEPWILIDDGA